MANFSRINLFSEICKKLKYTFSAITKCHNLCTLQQIVVCYDIQAIKNDMPFYLCIFSKLKINYLCCTYNCILCHEMNLIKYISIKK